MVLFTPHLVLYLFPIRLHNDYFALTQAFTKFRRKCFVWTVIDLTKIKGFLRANISDNFEENSGMQCVIFTIPEYSYHCTNRVFPMYRD